jgi:hypothetical protein
MAGNEINNAGECMPWHWQSEDLQQSDFAGAPFCSWFASDIDS